LIAQPASGISAAGMTHRSKHRPQTLPRVRMARHRRTLWLLAVTALLVGAITQSATAQPAQPAAPAQPGAPQQTTATYEDWIVRCETLSGPPVRKSCEMVQYTQAKGGQGVISQVAIGRVSKNDPVKLVIQLPIGIWLPSGVKLVADAKDPGLVATFKRCLPQACFADVDISNDALRRYRAVTEQGQIVFKDGNQKDATLPVSFKGFGTAFDALAKE
jgi:invasion protein IalB